MFAGTVITGLASTGGWAGRVGVGGQSQIIVPCFPTLPASGRGIAGFEAVAAVHETVSAKEWV